MIQKIVKNSDIKFCVDEDSKIQDKFIIKFYTINKAKGITRTADDVIVKDGKRYIKLNWSTLKLLDNGMLNYEVNNLDSDADYDDGVYNSTFTRTTYYYLCTDGDGLVDAVEEIELRLDQFSTDITDEKTARENGDAQLAEKLKNTNDRLNVNVIDLGNRINGIGESVSDYSNSIGELQMLCELYGSEIQTVDNRSTNNKENITGLQNRMTVVETKSTSNEENITDLQNRMSSVETKSTNNENSINTMSNELTELKGMVGNNNPDYSSLVSRLEKLEANEAVNINHRITMLEKSKDNLDKRIEEAKNTKVQLNQNYPKSYSYEKLNRRLDNISSRVSALENGTQGSNESTSSSLATEPSSLATEPSSLATEPSALETDNNSIVNRVSTLEENIQDINILTPDVEESLKDIVLRFPLNTSYENPIIPWLDSFETRVSALERGTQGSNESTSSLATEPSALEDRASTPEEASALEDRASTPEEASALENRVLALENGTQNLDNSIQALQNWIQSFNSRWPNGVSFSDISSQFANIEKRIAALESK